MMQYPISGKPSTARVQKFFIAIRDSRVLRMESYLLSRFSNYDAESDLSHCDAVNKYPAKNYNKRKLDHPEPGACEEAEMDSSSDWRTTNRGAVARARYLLSSGQWSDCAFLVGEPSRQELVAAHTLPLVSSSPVFEAMFFGSIPAEKRPIQVPDIEAATFRTMLEFIYTDQVSSLHADLALSLCYCAKKYMLPDLVQPCVNYLLSNVTPETVCEIYRQAKLFENSKLMGRCLKVMGEETKKVLTSASWADADKATVSDLLGQKYLLIDTELDLYDALLVWSKAECTRKSLPADKESLRSVAGDLLGTIRFFTLTPEEFTNGPAKGEILEQDEIVAIFMNKFSNDGNTPMPQGFSVEKTSRHKPDDHKQISPASSMSVWLSPPLPEKISSNVYGAVGYFCYRHFSPAEDFLSYRHTICHLSFRVDTNIKIVAVLVPTQVDLEAADSSNIYQDGFVACLSAPDSSTTRAAASYVGDTPYNKLRVLRFDRAAMIEKHKDYRMEVVFMQPGRYPSGDIARSVVSEGVTFAFYHERNYNRWDQLIRGFVFVKC